MIKWISRSYILVGASLSLVLSTPVQAANWSEMDTLDGQCVAYYADEIIASESVAAGTMGLFGYFVGKIEGRNPGFNVSDLLTIAFVAEVMNSWDSIGTRCAKESQKLIQNLDSAAQVI